MYYYEDAYFQSMKELSKCKVKVSWNGNEKFNLILQIYC